MRYYGFMLRTDGDNLGKAMGCMSGNVPKVWPVTTKKLDTGHRWRNWFWDHWSCLVDAGQRAVEKMCSSCTHSITRYFPQS